MGRACCEGRRVPCTAGPTADPKDTAGCASLDPLPADPIPPPAKALQGTPSSHSTSCVTSPVAWHRASASILPVVVHARTRSP